MPTAFSSLSAFIKEGYSIDELKKDDHVVAFFDIL